MLESYHACAYLSMFCLCLTSFLGWGVVKYTVMQPNNGQYDFIMSPGGGKQPKGLLGGSMNNKKFIAIASGGVLLLLLLITMLFSGGGPSNADLLLKVAQRQNELIRVAGIGVKEARGTDALNLARTVELNLKSDQTPLLEALKAQKVKVNPKQLTMSSSSETTKMLTEAAQNNRFDEAFVTFIQAELLNYQKDLKEAYSTSTKSALKDTLKRQYDNASVLISTETE